MITQIFPKDFQRYLSLPVLGPLMDAFAAWLQDRHYTWRSIRITHGGPYLPLLETPGRSTDR